MSGVVYHQRMRCLIVATNSQLTSALRFSASSALNCEFTEALTSERAISALLSDQTPDLLILEDAPAFKLVIQYLQSVSSPVALVILHTASGAAPVAGPTGLRVLGITTLDHGLTDLARILDQAGLKGGRAGHDADSTEAFVAIPTGLLIRMGPLAADIYIALTSRRYLKIFQVGDLIDEQDVRHYYFKKGLAYLYCRKEDSNALLSSLQESLSRQMQETDGAKDGNAIVSEVADLIYSFLEQGPMTEELGRMASQAVDFAVKTVKSNPGMKELFEQLRREDGRYRANHAAMLAHISSCIAIRMKWVTDETLERLCLAALFHDIAIPSDSLARVDDLNGRNFPGYDPDDQEKRLLVELHSIEGAMQLRKAGPMPREVDTLIIQHHEKPDGTGFPGKLTHSQISPLSALFIVAHEVVQLVLDEKLTLQAVPERLEAKYSQGNFKPVLRAFSELCLEE